MSNKGRGRGSWYFGGHSDELGDVGVAKVTVGNFFFCLCVQTKIAVFGFWEIGCVLGKHSIQLYNNMYFMR